MDRVDRHILVEDYLKKAIFSMFEPYFPPWPKKENTHRFLCTQQGLRCQSRVHELKCPEIEVKSTRTLILGRGFRHHWAKPYLIPEIMGCGQSQAQETVDSAKKNRVRKEKVQKKEDNHHKQHKKRKKKKKVNHWTEKVRELKITWVAFLVVDALRTLLQLRAFSASRGTETRPRDWTGRDAERRWAGHGPQLVLPRDCC